MSIANLLQIVIVVLLILLPPVLVAYLVRLRPIYQLAQRSRSMRTLVVLGSGLLYSLVSYGILLWLASYVFFGLAAYYDQTPVSGAETFSVVNELWLRQIIPGGTAPACFNRDPAVCRLADGAFDYGAPAEALGIILIPILLTTLVVLLLCWRFTRPRDGSKAG
jgi:hypothetical protein